MLNYLLPRQFMVFDPMRDQGPQNFGGGAGTKIANVLRAVSFCDILACDSVSDLNGSMMLVEPLCFKDGSDDELLSDIVSYGAFANILYSTDTHPLRWSGNFRSSVLDHFSGDYNCITYCCDYQRLLWNSLGFKDMQLLVDPIDTDLFVPLPKKLQIVACGRISACKNSEFIRDLFVALKDIEQISTVYVGGSSLYGDPNLYDIELEHEIRMASDIFMENVSQIEVARAMGESAFFVGNTVYETFSESHCESLAAGCVSVCGGHPVFSERPGFYRDILTVDEVVQVLDDYTAGFTRLPVDEHFEMSRDWALNNVSSSVFNVQLKSILSEWFPADSYVIEV